MLRVLPAPGGSEMRQTWTAFLLILFACGPVVASTPGKMPGPQYEIDPTGRVVRRDAGGKVAWATRLGGPFNFGRDGGLAWDEWRVYVSLEDGVTALDATTGKLLWQGTGASKRL